MPAFQSILTPGEEILNMVMPTERDADFYWRGIQVSNPGSLLGLRFRTPDGAYMADDYALMENFSGFSGAAGGIPGGAPVALESEVLVLAGAVLLLDAKNMV
jgi:hypothetical protein